jgi:hypothetical protein
MNKFVEPRPYADPEAAAKKLMEIANAVEPVRDPPTLIGKFAQPCPQRGVSRSAGSITNHRPVRADDQTGPPFRKAHDGLQVRLPRAGRRALPFF